MKHNHNRSTKHTLKRHVQKLNELFVRIQSFENQCIMLHSFWKQGEIMLTFHWLVWKILILIHSVYPMQKHYFLKQYHQKHGKVCLYRKCYQYKLLVSFSVTKTTPAITKYNCTGEKYLLNCQSYRRVLP